MSIAEVGPDELILQLFQDLSLILLGEDNLEELIAGNDLDGII